MPETDNALLQQVRDTMLRVEEQVKTAFRRIEGNEKDIKALEERTVENDKAISAQAQWMRDMERREQLGLTLMTVVLTAMIWFSNFILG